MSTPANPPPNPGEIARQKLILKVVIAVLLAGAGLVVWLATPVPLALRLFVAATDVTLAAVIWLLMWQKFHPK